MEVCGLDRDGEGQDGGDRDIRIGIIIHIGILTGIIHIIPNPRWLLNERPRYIYSQTGSPRNRITGITAQSLKDIIHM